MAEPLHDLVGTLVGDRYRVVRRLGSGGMGTVYVANQAPLGREVALKVLRADLAHDDVAVERFKREAQLIGGLGHPHIVTVVDSGAAADGTLYIAMELLRGEDLAARIRRTGPLTASQALGVVEQIARALAGAHGRNVIHRDLKPANVILMNVDGAGDFVKVLDFGVAKLVRDPSVSAGAPPTGDGQTSVTGGGFVPGTAGYIAPEIIAGDATGEDPRADLYSLGVTWFEMVTGRCPFVGASAVSVLLKQVNDDPPRPHDIGAVDVPPRHEALLMRLLSRDPTVRPSSAQALLGELAELRRESDSAAEVTLSAVSRPRTRHVAAGVVGGSFVAVVAALLGVVSLVPRDTADTTEVPASPSRAAIYYPDHPTVIEPVLRAPAPATPKTTSPRPTVQVKTPGGRDPVAVAAADPPAQAMPAPAPAPAPAPEPTPTVTADERWRDEVLSTLSGCNEGCAKSIVGRLRSIDVSAFAPAARAGINECVSKCRR